MVGGLLASSTRARGSGACPSGRDAWLLLTGTPGKETHSLYLKSCQNKSCSHTYLCVLSDGRGNLRFNGGANTPLY